MNDETSGCLIDWLITFLMSDIIYLYSFVFVLQDTLREAECQVLRDENQQQNLRLEALENENRALRAEVARLGQRSFGQRVRAVFKQPRVRVNLRVAA